VGAVRQILARRPDVGGRDEPGHDEFWDATGASRGAVRE
jgi:hypothetical protein